MAANAFAHHLSAALDAARGTTREDALSEMLEAWRIAPDPVLGDLIDDLTNGLSQNAPMYSPDAKSDFFARDATPRKIEEIQLDNGPHPDDIDATFDAPGLPHLRHLGIGVFSPARVHGKQEHNWLPVERYASFFSCPMVSRLEKLDIDVHPHFLSEWIDAIQKYVPATVEASLRLGHGSTLRRDGAGKFTCLATTFDASNLHWVLETLDMLDGRLLTSFELFWRGRVDGSPELRARLIAKIDLLRKAGTRSLSRRSTRSRTV